MEKGKLVGIISLTDIQRMSFSGTYGEDELTVDDTISDLFTAGTIMHEHPETLNVVQSIREAARSFAEREFHAFPVMEGEKLAGIVTTTDILKYITS